MILVFGSINLDLIFAVRHIPAPGETVLCPDIRIEPGGKGANQAVAAGRDGAPVMMAGAVGRDALAAGALRLLREARIDLSRVIETNASTGCASIAVDPGGENAIAVGSGANLLVHADQVEDAVLVPATTVLLQMEVPAAQSAALIRRARGRGARIVLNLAPALPVSDDALRLVDLLVANETEAATLASQYGCGGDAAALRQALGVDVVRTLGADGIDAATASGPLRIAAVPIVPVDTTAAGDCFVGVLASRLDRGSTLADALLRANAAAALCCMRPGSQGSIPTSDETDEFIAARVR